MKASLSANFALATVIGIIPASHVLAVVNIAYVPVANPGNAPDTTSFGAVAYEYMIAKNETSIGQYCEFLNAAAKADPYSLFSSNMASNASIAGITRSGTSGTYSYSVIGSTANKPITFVSWFDAARFCNWLHNGQGSGSTETGAYTLNGAMSGIYTVVPGARAWIPSEDEWYKAAYYDPAKGGTGGYWLYPNQRNSLNGNTIGVAGAMNYYDGDYVGNYPNMLLTDVGAYGPNSDSFYGTNDQGGNVNEWNDLVAGGSMRGVRGGSWFASDSDNLDSGSRNGNQPNGEYPFIGFRVASIPEPSCLVLTLLASGMLLTRRKL